MRLLSGLAAAVIVAAGGVAIGFLAAPGGVWDAFDQGDAVADVETVPPDLPTLATNDQKPDTANAPTAAPCAPEDFPDGGPGQAACSENAYSKFEGVIAGIRIAADASHYGDHTVACSKPPPLRRADSEVTLTSGTPFDIFADGLPKGVTDAPGEHPVAWVCSDGVIVSADRLLIGTYGSVYIVKYLRAEAWIAEAVPAARISERVVAGSRSVVVSPSPGDNTGRISFAEPYKGNFVVTTIIGYGATMDNLIRFAEELLK